MMGGKARGMAQPRSYRMGSMGAPMSNGVQAPYGPFDFAVDAGWKFLGQPLYNIASGKLMQDVSAPRDQVPLSDDPREALAMQELNRSNAAAALGSGMEAGGLAALGSFGAKAPAGALRSGPARPDAGLDMSQAARLQRAREMGFDTDNVWYHGGPGGIDSFKPNSFFHEDPGFASAYARYADAGAVYPAHLKMSNPLRLKEMADNPYSEGNVVQDAIKNGYDGILVDDGRAVSFNPSNIRSVNAAFDPAKSGSANLMAANPFPGAVVPMFAPPDRRKR